MGKVIFEDKDILVYFKDIGENSEQPSMNTADRIFPVHRLDLPVSGLMVYGKSQHTAELLIKSISEHEFTKIYTAEVAGHPEANGRYEDYLYHDKRANKTFPVKGPRKGAKLAVLTYEVVNCRDTSSIVEVHLFTGRTHQIRVQFASRRHPILGDGKYGSRFKGNIRLCASHLEFKHPITHQVMAFTCDPWFIENEN